MSDASAVVTRFCDAWADGDFDALMTYFTEDAVYENVPVDPPNQGKEQIRKTIEGFAGLASKIEFVVHHQSAAGNVVMNERTDHFHTDSGTISLRVMGVFEVEGDKIKVWRDYFDLAQYMSQLPGQGG